MGEGGEDAFKEWAIEFGAELCKKCLDAGACGLHFYTLNLEKVTLGMLKKLGLITAEQHDKCLSSEADAKTMVSAQGITTDKGQLCTFSCVPAKPSRPRFFQRGAQCTFHRSWHLPWVACDNVEPSHFGQAFQGQLPGCGNVCFLLRF